MKTKLSDRPLPDYSRKEELINMATHIAGGVFAVAASILCIAKSIRLQNNCALITTAIYGILLILLYTVSSVYHGLKHPIAKRVMRIVDHCTIYFLIAGTYTPIAVCSLTTSSQTVAWSILAVVWGLLIVAVTLTAIDMKKFSVFSMICYIGMGWCVIFVYNTALEALTMSGFILLISGGIAYTIGAVLYGIGKKVPYMHSIFHLFVIAGSVLHFLTIYFYVIL